jgi:TPR repeat protein
MKQFLLAFALLVVGCKKSEPAKDQPGGSGAAKVADPGKTPEVPPRTAPPTAEVLAQFDKACDAGVATACYDSGMRRARGDGTGQDRVAGVVWLEKGCKLDDAESCALLAGFVGVGEGGVPQDRQRAFDLYQRTCPKVPSSCTLLAGFYGRGELVAPDGAKAIGLVEQGCNAGHAKGCEDLANRYADGDGVDRNVARAFELATKACNLEAMNCEALGAFYIGGTGTDRDSTKGRELVEKACKAGSARACEGMRLLNGQ